MSAKPLLAPIAAALLTALASQAPAQTARSIPLAGPIAASAQDSAEDAGHRGRAMAAPVAAPEPVGVVRVDLTAEGSASQNLSIPRGKSAIVELPVDARDVMVTNPAVADAVLRSPRRIYVMGIGSGQTDAAFFDAAGRRILSLNIRVDQDTSAAAQTINRLLPGSSVHVDSVNNSLILSGRVANLADADKAVQIAAQFVGKPEQVVNMLSIAGKEQVMLKVRIVEMQRSIIKQFGVNVQALINQTGEVATIYRQAATFGLNGGLLGGTQAIGSYNKNDTSVTAGLSAFERAGLVRTLAEPNLTAVSGESAKFLAGGEFPVPADEDNNGRVTVIFKPFGVGLGFTPVVLSEGRISLKLSTEVSELSNIGAFTITAGPGAPTLTLPALSVRRAETTVELPSGGSLMIAGLLQNKTKQNLDKVPGLGELPVLGALFRSRDFQNDETELVVIVTPYLVNPTSPANLQTPVDGMLFADDASTLLLGQLNKAYHAPSHPAAGRTFQGPYGYVIE